LPGQLEIRVCCSHYHGVSINHPGTPSVVRTDKIHCNFILLPRLPLPIDLQPALPKLFDFALVYRIYNQWLIYPGAFLWQRLTMSS